MAKKKFDKLDDKLEAVENLEAVEKPVEKVQGRYFVPSARKSVVADDAASAIMKVQKPNNLNEKEIN